MQKLLYYPDIEITDINFLKFSLIYVDKMNLLLPEAGRDWLNPGTKRVLENTDLLDIIQPDHDSGKVASAVLIDFLEKTNTSENYTKDGKRLNDFFAGRKDYVLYLDKCSSDFVTYCLENNLAVRYKNGLKINENIAYSYLSILADIISKDREINMITDNARYSDRCFHGYDRKINVYKRLNIITNEIHFQLPVDMRKIPLEQFIALRLDEQFNSVRRNYLFELNRALDKQDYDLQNTQLHDYINCKNELYGLIKEKLSSCGAIVVGGCSFRNEMIDPNLSLDFFRSIGSEMLSLDNLKTYLKDEKEFIGQLEKKKQARRFLIKLHGLGLGG